jgi:hypothetical protein
MTFRSCMQYKFSNFAKAPEQAPAMLIAQQVTLYIAHSKQCMNIVSPGLYITAAYEAHALPGFQSSHPDRVPHAGLEAKINHQAACACAQSGAGGYCSAAAFVLLWCVSRGKAVSL